MGKLVEATRLGYYGNARRRPGDQFVMADSDFKKVVVGKDGKPEHGLLGAEKHEDVVPSWVVVIADGYEDPIVEKEADKKKSGQPVKRAAIEKKPDDHRQGGAFDVHPETGVQVTGQVAPARPAASSVHDSTIAPAAADAKKDAKKSSGDRSVI